MPQLFLKFYDRFGALQPLLQPEVVSPRKRKFRGQRVWLGGFGAALGQAQRVEDARGTLTPPVQQDRRVKPLAAQDGADPSGDTRRSVSLPKDAQFVLRRKSAATGTVQKFMRRSSRRWNYRRPPAFQTRRRRRGDPRGWRD